MALTQRLEIRQSHALVMTPQLMQAIKLLQLSNLDLASYVENELERNPLLERTGDAEAEQPAAEAGAAGDGAAVADWTAGDADMNGSAPERSANGLDDISPEDAPAAAARVGNDIPAGYSEWAGTGSGGREDGDYNLEAFLSVDATLADHLAEQLALAIADPVRRMIGRYLLDLVDEAGYLTGDLATVADRLGASPAEVETVLAVLQAFDPPGVCARNLTECLTIQLRERNRFDPAMQALVAHLDLLAKRDIPGLKKACGVSEEDLIDMIAEIRHLNPKPGLAFGTTLVQPIVPDVFVRPGVDGGFLVELNSETLPKVLVNQSYYAQVARTARNDKEKTYLADCLQTYVPSSAKRIYFPDPAASAWIHRDPVWYSRAMRRPVKATPTAR
jgi:RNA polymerase sigma-54 factor